MPRTANYKFRRFLQSPTTERDTREWIMRQCIMAARFDEALKEIIAQLDNGAEHNETELQFSIAVFLVNALQMHCAAYAQNATLYETVAACLAERMRLRSVLRKMEVVSSDSTFFATLMCEGALYCDRLQRAKKNVFAALRDMDVHLEHLTIFGVSWSVYVQETACLIQRFNEAKKDVDWLCISAPPIHKFEMFVGDILTQSDGVRISESSASRDFEKWKRPLLEAKYELDPNNNLCMLERSVREHALRCFVLTSKFDEELTARVCSVQCEYSRVNENSNTKSSKTDSHWNEVAKFLHSTINEFDAKYAHSKCLYDAVANYLLARSRLRTCLTASIRDACEVNEIDHIADSYAKDTVRPLKLVEDSFTSNVSALGLTVFDVSWEIYRGDFDEMKQRAVQLVQ